MTRVNALNDALSAALARGERPFKCWACREWFTETGKRGTPRVVCGSKHCTKVRQHFYMTGCEPPCRGHETRGGDETLERAIMRAVAVDWLKDSEIAEELGCSPQQVSVIRTKRDRNKFKRKARAA